MGAMVVMTGCSGSGSEDEGDRGPESTAGSTAPLELAAGEDLYALADDFEPGEPGEVIAVQEVAGDAALEGTVLRVLYHSESLEGEDIAVSGAIIVPDGPAPSGGRPVLSWAHGTTGIADQCAPSLDPSRAGPALAAPFLERDMVFVATDYEGLGTPGRHPYIAGESEARGTLDIVRAARQLSARTGASDRAVLWGHSQGGHAVLFANQVAREWAPELDVVGTVAGAPPSHLPLIADALRDSPYRFYLGMVAAGWSAAYPDADLSLVLTPLGIELLAQVDEKCAGELAEAWSSHDYDELVSRDPNDVEPWATLLVDNDPGFEVGASPVLIIHGENDEQIPLISSELLVDRMCGVGQTVHRRTYPGATHSGAIGASMSDMLEWIDARLAGTEAPSDCA
ncbi:MAG: alpha/beta fold hydrolase [Acidimicrobiales bacterium]